MKFLWFTIIFILIFVFISGAISKNNNTSNINQKQYKYFCNVQNNLIKILYNH